MKQGQSITSSANGLKVAVVGGTAGLGRAIAHDLVARGASVITVGQTNRDDGNPSIQFVKADLSLMSEAKRVAAALPAESLDMCIFTTGILAAPQREETSEGLERDLAVSYLSRYVIARDIAPRIGASRAPSNAAALAKPRVFIMGFPGSGQTGMVDDLNSEKTYGALSAHSNTVVGNEILVLHMAEEFKNIDVFGLNPGIIRTNIRDNLLGAGSWKSTIIESIIGCLTPSPEKFASVLVPQLLSSQLEGKSGAMLGQKGDIIAASKNLNADFNQRYMQASESLEKKALNRI